jgi:5-methyltetrahydrofolate--homocysteine methyltransferase
MAKTKERKMEIAEKLICLCKEFGLKDNDIFIDFLTFTLGSGDNTLTNAAVETLKAIDELKTKHRNINTILGISNISYGLKPSIRKILNSIFLFEAVKYGLTAAIFHAGKVIPIHGIDKEAYAVAKDLIYNKKEQHYNPLEKLIEKGGEFKIESMCDSKLPVEKQVEWIIVNGSKANLEETLKTALRKYTGLEIINKLLLPSMEKVGKMFKTGEIQLPFVLKSAEVMKLSVNFLKPFFDRKNLKPKGSIMLATVKGDVHDIGKNLVDIILSNNGFKVYNIGINIGNEEIVENIQKYSPDYLGLSGLLVKSAFVMKELLQFLNNCNISIPVFIGGAALTKEYVETELREVYKGSVFYAKDAFEAVNIIEKGKLSEVPNGIKVKAKQEKTAVITTIANIKNYSLPQNKIPVPPFWGVKQLFVTYDEISHLVNKKLLFKWKWKEKSKDKAKLKYKKLEDICINNSLFDFKCSYGYFKCKSQKNTLKVSDTEVKFVFEREQKQPFRCLTDYFRKDQDVLPLFLVTAGNNLSFYISDLYKKDKYEDYYSFYHFANQLTEALAEFIHLTIRKELKIGKDTGKRYSPGYSVWPDLTNQKEILTLLRGNEIGVTLSETFQLRPEQSITAMVVHNNKAEYFSV